MTAAGSKEAAIATGSLMLDAGNVYTAIAVNGAMEGALPQLVLLDDFVATP